MTSLLAQIVGHSFHRQAELAYVFVVTPFARVVLANLHILILCYRMSQALIC